jgi:chromate transporter
MNPLLFFGLSLKASLLSTGGLGNVPSLHSDLLSKGFATEKTFGEAIAVGQVSPGPNGLWVISLGYFVGGITCALAALVSVSLPPLLVLVSQKLYARVKHHPAVEGFMSGLSIAVVGIFGVVLYRLLGATGIDIKSVTIIALCLALAFTKRVPVLAIIVLGALLGLVPF